MKQATISLSPKQQNDLIMLQRTFDEKVGQFRLKANATTALGSREYMLASLYLIECGQYPAPFPEGMATFEREFLREDFEKLMRLYAEDDKTPAWADRIKLVADRIRSRREF